MAKTDKRGKCVELDLSWYKKEYDLKLIQLLQLLKKVIQKLAHKFFKKKKKQNRPVSLILKTETSSLIYKQS